MARFVCGVACSSFPDVAGKRRQQGWKRGIKSLVAQVADAAVIVQLDYVEGKGLIVDLPLEKFDPLQDSRNFSSDGIVVVAESPHMLATSGGRQPPVD